MVPRLEGRKGYLCQHRAVQTASDKAQEHALDPISASDIKLIP